MTSWDYWTFVILIAVGFFGLGQELAKITRLLGDIHAELANRDL